MTSVSVLLLEVKHPSVFHCQSENVNILTQVNFIQQNSANSVNSKMIKSHINMHINLTCEKKKITSTAKLINKIKIPPHTIKTYCFIYSIFFHMHTQHIEISHEDISVICDELICYYTHTHWQNHIDD